MNKGYLILIILFLVSCKKTEIKKGEASAAPVNYIPFTNSPYAMEAEPTSDGGLMFSGYTNTFNSNFNDGFLTKLGADGKLQWTKTFGGFQDDGFYHAIETSDGGCVAVGYTSSFGFGTINSDYLPDAYIVKTDKDGNILWEKETGGYETDRYFYVLETPDHYYIATGRYNLNGYEYILISKFDESGNVIWNKAQTIKQNSWINIGMNIALDPNGDYVIACYTTPSSKAEDGRRYYTYLMGINAGTGNRTWFRSYDQFIREGYATYHRPNIKLFPVQDGFIVGTYLTYLGGYSKIQVMKVGTTGILDWEKQYDNFDNSILSDMMPAEDGGYYIVGGTTKELPSGYYQGSFLEQQNLLVKIDKDGAVQWWKKLGSANVSTRAIGFRKSENGFLIGSHAYINNKNKQEIYTIKTDLLGNLIP